MPTLTEAVLACEKQRENALLAHDTAALGELLAQGVVFVHSSATADTKVQLLDKLNMQRLRYESLHFSDLQVTPLAGERSAMLWGVMNARIVVAGVTKAVRSRYLAVWAYDPDGQLRMQAHQGTPLPS